MGGLSLAGEGQGQKRAEACHDLLARVTPHPSGKGGISMKRWLLVGVGVLAAGCATGLPGSYTRNFYNLCIAEGKEPGYCEAWAPVEADKLAAGRVGMGILLTVPVGR